MHFLDVTSSFSNFHSSTEEPSCFNPFIYQSYVILATSDMRYTNKLLAHTTCMHRIYRILGFQLFSQDSPDNYLTEITALNNSRTQLKNFENP